MRIKDDSSLNFWLRFHSYSEKFDFSFGSCFNKNVELPTLFGILLRTCINHKNYCTFVGWNIN